jgi:hypothetical protein
MDRRERHADIEKWQRLQLSTWKFAANHTNCSNATLGRLKSSRIVHREIDDLIKVIDCFFETVLAALNKYSRTQLLNSSVIVLDRHFSLDKR